MEFLYGIFVLCILPFGVALFILFYVMKAAVKSAIGEIQIKAKKDAKAEIDKEDAGNLIALRDMEILNDTELEEVIEIYKSVRMDKENNEQYLKYSKILCELKNIKHFDEEEYIDKSDLLKKYFNIS